MFPNEVSNHICSYIESPTSKIIKGLFFKPMHCLKLNKKYNYVHVNMPRLINALRSRCPHCITRLNPHEYIFISLYEKMLNKKLCFECLEKEKYRLVFEFSELIILLIIILCTWSYAMYIITFVWLFSTYIFVCLYFGLVK